MLYLRTKANPAGSNLSPMHLRFSALFALLAYPAGGLAILSGALPLGLGLVFAAFVFAFLVIRSSAQRIVAEAESELDERELAQRSAALGAAYKIFTALALLATVYLALASDNGLWLPHGYEQFNFIIWGVFLYAVILPAAVLAWTDPGPFDRSA